MDISQKTGHYLHGADDIMHLSFPTGGVPRSFSVIAYSAKSNDEIDFSENGIAVVDNDQMSVVLDRHLCDEPQAQIEFMDSVRKMDWNAFGEFCCSHPRLRVGSPDLYLEHPDKGILANQIHLGVTTPPSSDEDIRSANMIKADANPACPYSFPKASRQDMIDKIMSHDAIRDDSGLWHLAWTTSISEDLATKGRVQGTKIHDADWEGYYRSSPEIFHQLHVEILEPYLTGRVSTWPDTDAGRYQFGVQGVGQGAMLYLDAIDGAGLSFGGKGELGAFLNALHDPVIRDLWKVVQVVDQTLANMDRNFEQRLVQIRSEFETSLENSASPVLE